MAKAGGVVGFVGVDEISLDLAASLLRSGCSVQAFQVSPIFLFSSAFSGQFEISSSASFSCVFVQSFDFC